MDRLEALIKKPKRTLGVLAAVLVAVGVAIGSGANFTASTANPDNVFTAGALDMENSKDGTAILTASGMKPGDSVQGVVDIENTGTVAGDFTLSRSALTDTPVSPAMSGKLNVKVDDCGEFSGSTPPDCDSPDSTVYDGLLSAMTASEGLGEYSAGEQHRYRFTVTFASDADDTYEGASSTATFKWDAVSN